jgi:phage tail tape-measure protein
MKCPRCGSTHISNREVGKRTGATVGSLFGAAVGTATALRGAQVGAALGAMAGPVGIVAGGLTGAIVTGLLAGSAGCAVGSVAGNLADSNFLDNRGCLDCGHTFREDVAPTSVNVQYTPAVAAAAQQASQQPVDAAAPGQSTVAMHFYEE